MFTHYGVPKYIAGMGVSAIAYKTDCWNISRLDNSFQLSGIMMLDTEMESEAEAERLVQTAEKRFAGTPGQVMFVVGGGEEGNSSRFIPLESNNEGDWSTLHDQATSDIVIAHSWFRSLSGLDYSAGFSAERILHEYEVALNTVARDCEPPAHTLKTHLYESVGGTQGRRTGVRRRGREPAGLPVGDHEVQRN